MATTADPIREHVEATLHRIVDSATAVPCGLVRTARRSFGEPVAFARTMVNLALSGLLGRDVDGDPAEPVGHVIRDRPQTQDDSANEAARSEANASAAVDLPIDDYENLAASHIVARLDRLDRDELVEIKDFELANRGRRTVIGKIDQLLAHT